MSFFVSAEHNREGLFCSRLCFAMQPPVLGNAPASETDLLLIIACFAVLFVLLLYWKPRSAIFWGGLLGLFVGYCVSLTIPNGPGLTGRTLARNFLLGSMVLGLIVGLVIGLIKEEKSGRANDGDKGRGDTVDESPPQAPVAGAETREEKGAP